MREKKQDFRLIILKKKMVKQYLTQKKNKNILSFRNNNFVWTNIFFNEKLYYV